MWTVDAGLGGQYEKIVRECGRNVKWSVREVVSRELASATIVGASPILSSFGFGVPAPMPRSVAVTALTVYASLGCSLMALSARRKVSEWLPAFAC